MDILLFILVLFILGSLGLYFLQVAKNVAYIFFVLTVGYGMWHYVGPYLVSDQNNLEDALIVLNQRFTDRVGEEIHSTATAPTIQESVERDLRTLIERTDAVIRPSATEETPQEHASAPSPLDPLRKVVKVILHILNLR